MIRGESWRTVENDDDSTTDATEKNEEELKTDMRFEIALETKRSWPWEKNTEWQPWGRNESDGRERDARDEEKTLALMIGWVGGYGTDDWLGGWL